MKRFKGGIWSVQNEDGQWVVYWAPGDPPWYKRAYRKITFTDWRNRRKLARWPVMGYTTDGHETEDQ